MIDNTNQARTAIKNHNKQAALKHVKSALSDAKKIDNASPNAQIVPIYSEIERVSIFGPVEAARNSKNSQQQSGMQQNQSANSGSQEEARENRSQSNQSEQAMNRSENENNKTGQANRSQNGTAERANTNRQFAALPGSSPASRLTCRARSRI